MASLTIADSAVALLHPTRQRALARRWQDWLPWVAMERRDMEATRARHIAIVLDCLRRGLNFDNIRRHDLDDPRIDEPVRDRRIAALLERKQVRLHPRRRPK